MTVDDSIGLANQRSLTAKKLATILYSQLGPDKKLGILDPIGLLFEGLSNG